MQWQRILVLGAGLAIGLVGSGCGDASSTAPETAAAGTTPPAATPVVVVETPPVPESWDGYEPQVRDWIKVGLKDVRKRPDDPAAWTDLCRIYFANDNVDLAVPCCEKALAMDDTDPRRWYLLARSRAELGDVPGALAAVDRAIALLPYDGYVDAPEQGHFDDGHGHSHGTAEPDAPTLRTFTETDAWFLFWRRGFWALEEGNLDEAQTAFERARALRPDDPIVIVGLARTAMERGDAAAAVPLLESLAHQQNMPNIPYVRDLLGRAYQQVGRTDEAAGLLATEAIGSLSWPDPWADPWYGDRKFMDWMIVQAHHMVANGQAHAAVHYLYDLEYYHGENPLVLKILAQAYFGDQQPEKAMELLNKIIELDPNDFSAHLNLGHMYELRGEWDKAESVSRRAHELRPNDMKAHFQFVRSLIASGRLSEAIAECEVIIEDSPELPAAWAWLARAQAETGEFQLAQETLAKGIALDENDNDVLQAANWIRRIQAERQ